MQRVNPYRDEIMNLVDDSLSDYSTKRCFSVLEI